QAEEQTAKFDQAADRVNAARRYQDQQHWRYDQGARGIAHPPRPPMRSNYGRVFSVTQPEAHDTDGGTDRRAQSGRQEDEAEHVPQSAQRTIEIAPTHD